MAKVSAHQVRAVSEVGLPGSRMPLPTLRPTSRDGRLATKAMAGDSFPQDLQPLHSHELA
ncbi:MAG: hypothetical protein OXC26_11165 [Albidovulum sp.]|nr:hypothetical protein [Albidovulum sp.]